MQGYKATKIWNPISGITKRFMSTTCEEPLKCGVKGVNETQGGSNILILEKELNTVLIRQFMVDMGCYQTIWSPALPNVVNVTWHSRTWPYAVSPSITPTYDLVTKLGLITEFNIFIKLHEVFIEHLQWMGHAKRGRLLLRTPGLVTFGTCIWSNIETEPLQNFSYFRTFQFRTPLRERFPLKRGIPSVYLPSLDLPVVWLNPWIFSIIFF